MGGFTTGLVAGSLLGVCGTFLFLSLGAAFSVERARVSSRFPSWNSSFHLPPALFAAFCHRVSIGKDASMLLLLLEVLVVSMLEGLLNWLIATAIAALILVFWFFPHVRSAMIKRSSDRLALALFLILATLGSRLLGHEESSAL
jgi:K+-sensing histidine kinase KdpD